MYIRTGLTLRQTSRCGGREVFKRNFCSSHLVRPKIIPMSERIDTLKLYKLNALNVTIASHFDHFCSNLPYDP